MDSKHFVIGLFLVVVFISGCISDGTPEGPKFIDFVDEVRWESVSESQQCPIMGSPSNLCLAPLELVFTWRGGYVDHKGFSCCLDCERYAPACQLGNKVVEFSTGNLPLSPRVHIPGHKPQAGMIIWTRAGGIQDGTFCEDPERAHVYNKECYSEELARINCENSFGATTTELDGQLRELKGAWCEDESHTVCVYCPFLCC